MTDEHYTPRTRTMSTAELFRHGLWEWVVAGWISGALIAIAWTAMPVVRNAAVTDPLLLALVCAALAGMAGETARSRYVHRPGAGRLHVTVLMLFGGAAGWVAAGSLFQPILRRAVECAPLVASGMPTHVSVVSFLLPCITWILWCRYLFAGLHGMGPDLDPARIRSFSKRFLRLPALRGVLTLIVLAAAAAVIEMRYHVTADQPPRSLMKALARGDAASLALLRSRDAMERIAAARTSAVAAARERLAALQLDAARPLVRVAACDLVLPGTQIEADLASAESAFARLDDELAYDFATWRPSSVSGRTLLELVPLGSQGSAPRFPFLWVGLARNAEAPVAAAEHDHFDIVYRDQKVMEAWVLSLQFANGARNAATTIKLLGTSGLDEGLADVVSRRLARRPAGEIQIVGAGAMCAQWNVEGVDVRLGPALIAGERVTPASPVWISFFDRSAIESWRLNGGRLSGVFAATYGCAQAQSR